MIQMTPNQYKSFIASNSKQKAKKSKYNNRITIVNGIRFHSEKEAEFYKELKKKQEKGEIERFHRQILCDLPGRVRHYIDFQVVTKDTFGFEWIEYFEIKGRDLPMGRLKRKQAEEIYGIEIKLI